MEEPPEENHSALEQPALSIYGIVKRIRREWRRRGPWQTVLFLFSRAFRCWRAVVYEADLEAPRSRTTWREGETLTSIGPEDLDVVITPTLRSFLGPEAEENLEGVREGNRLFVISCRGELLHCGYILFQTRQTKIIGEPDSPPVIACCFTSPAARGRGLYRKALNSELCYLQEQGYKRVVIETHPENLPSRKGIEAAGFRLRRTVSAWIVLNWLIFQKSVEASDTKWKFLAV